MLRLCLIVIFAASAYSASAGSPRVGDRFELSSSYRTEGNATDGSSSSSQGQNSYEERIIAVRDEGVELEFDLPKTATAEERQREWMVPSRILRKHDGSLQLLNRDELESRLDEWLRRAKWTREACGRWLFTWNAFKVECDPNVALQNFKAIDLLQTRLVVGGDYVAPFAVAPAQLQRRMIGPDHAQFTASSALDAKQVQDERARSDLVVGEITNHAITLGEASEKRSKDKVTGTVTVTFDSDATDVPWRRTTVTKTRTEKPDGTVENDTSTQIVERRRIPG